MDSLQQHLQHVLRRSGLQPAAREDVAQETLLAADAGQSSHAGARSPGVCDTDGAAARRRSLARSTRESLPDLERAFGEHTLEELVLGSADWGKTFEEAYRVRPGKRAGRDVYIVTATGDRPYEYVIDAQSGRFVARGYGGTESQTFDYPEVGPADIYDLGVPAHVPVIDGRAPPAVFALRDQVAAAQRVGFSNHRAVIIGAGPDWYRVVSADGVLCVDNYAQPEDAPCDPAALLDLAQAFLAAEELPLRKIATEVCDGRTEWVTSYGRDGRQREYVWPALQGSSWSKTVSSRCWWNRGFFTTWGEHQDEALGPDANGLVGLRMLKRRPKLTGRR